MVGQPLGSGGDVHPNGYKRKRKKGGRRTAGWPTALQLCPGGAGVRTGGRPGRTGQSYFVTLPERKDDVDGQLRNSSYVSFDAHAPAYISGVRHALSRDTRYDTRQPQYCTYRPARSADQRASDGAAARLCLSFLMAVGVPQFTGGLATAD